MNIVNRLLGLLVGLLLLGAGVLAAAETVLAFLGRQPWVVPVDRGASTLSELTWDDRTLMVAAVLTLVGGLLLVILQLWPRRTTALPMVEQKQDRLAAVDSRGLAELLRRSAVEDSDVLDADVRVSRRAARLSGRVPQDASLREVQSRTRERVQARVDALRLHHAVKVKVRMRRGKARVR